MPVGAGDGGSLRVAVPPLAGGERPASLAGAGLGCHSLPFFTTTLWRRVPLQASRELGASRAPVGGQTGLAAYVGWGARRADA